MTFVVGDRKNFGLSVISFDDSDWNRYPAKIYGCSVSAITAKQLQVPVIQQPNQNWSGDLARYGNRGRKTLLLIVGAREARLDLRIYDNAGEGGYGRFTLISMSISTRMLGEGGSACRMLISGLLLPF